MVVHTSKGFKLTVDRGPNWLFIKLRPTRHFVDGIPRIADQLWLMATRHFIYRVVLELEELDHMPPGLTAQLVLLQERLAECDGSLRICGLCHECEEVLSERHLDTAFPNFSTRKHAVLGKEITELRDKIKQIASESEADEASGEDLVISYAGA